MSTPQQEQFVFPEPTSGRDSQAVSFPDDPERLALREENNRFNEVFNRVAAPPTDEELAASVKMADNESALEAMRVARENATRSKSPNDERLKQALQVARLGKTATTAETSTNQD